MHVGCVLDEKYQLVRLIGEGAHGRVFAARHAVLGTHVAIKVLKRADHAESAIVERFLREARAAARLASDHVVRVLDVGQLPTGERFLIMELLEGIDLASLLRQAPIPPEQAARYLIEACSGVAEAHRHGIVHRDLKPSNLFLASRGDHRSSIVKVLDFGIATTSNEEFDRGLTSTESLLGSPAYMSPEQLRSSKHVDARSDVWSLGVTLYELLSGRRPFTAPTFAALSISIAIEHQAALSNVRPEVAAVVARCLAKDPAERYASAEQLSDALAHAMHADPRARRRKWPVAVALGVVALAIVAGASASSSARVEDRGGIATPQPAVPIITPSRPAVSTVAGEVPQPDRHTSNKVAVDVARTDPRNQIAVRKPTRVLAPRAPRVSEPGPSPEPGSAAPEPAEAPPTQRRCRPSELRCGL